MRVKKPKSQAQPAKDTRNPKTQPVRFGFEAPPVPTLVISKTKLKKKTVRKIIEAVEKL